MWGRLLLAAVMHQTMVLGRDEWERNNKFVAAQAQARHRNKPLLVVGGPWGTSPVRTLVGLQAHGCGDLCLDIDARACEGCLYQPGDIRQLPFPDRHFGAVFSSHVLEHLGTASNVQLAWNELHRVADSVFVCLPGKDNLIAWLAPEHHLWVKQEGSKTLVVEERDRGEGRPRESFLIEA